MRFKYSDDNDRTLVAESHPKAPDMSYVRTGPEGAYLPLHAAIEAAGVILEGAGVEWDDTNCLDNRLSKVYARIALQFILKSTAAHADEDYEAVLHEFNGCPQDADMAPRAADYALLGTMRN